MGVPVDNTQPPAAAQQQVTNWDKALGNTADPAVAAGEEAQPKERQSDETQADAAAAADSEFRCKLRDAADTMADATLRRIHAERRAKQMVDGCKEDEKQAHKVLQQLAKELPKDYPLLGSKPIEPPPEVATATGFPPYDGSLGNPPAWQGVEIEALGLPPGICKLLTENPDKSINTLGDLVFWQVNMDRKLSKIPRMGKAKCAKAEAACRDYFVQHPECFE